MLPTIAWDGDAIVMIDQRKLPVTEIYVTCRTANEVAKAIKTMVIRGAPAIGVCAAMGIALGVRAARPPARSSSPPSSSRLRADGGTRPTAVNLFWAIERMKRVVRRGARRPASRSTQIKDAARAPRPHRIHDEDVASCRAMGAHGATVVPDEARDPDALQRRGAGDGRLRHGARRDPRRGRGRARRVAVLADETRPFLQGARLTAWELVARRHRHDRHHRQHGRRADARRRRSTSWSSAPTGSPPTATSPTRSAPTRWRCWRRSTASRSTSRRRCRRSTWRRRTAPDIPIEERSAREVTHVGPDAG